MPSPIELNDRKPMRQQTAEPTIDYVKGDRRGEVKKVVRTPYAFIHPCRHPGCDKEGSFGFGVSLKRKKPGVWFCAEHRADGEAIGEAPMGLDW